MTRFTIKIAGCTAEVHSLFESTRDYCRAYLTEDAPEITITVTPEDLEFEQQALLTEALEEGFRIRKFTDPFLDRAAIQRKLAEHLFEKDTLLFHGSAIAVDGEGYLFTARSGTGKSTHTRLWRETFGSRAVMINDDKPFLQITSTGVMVCGSPWSGKHGLDANVTVPLKGICVLERGTENTIRPADAEEVLPMLQKQTVPPLAPEKAEKLDTLVEKLAERCPLWHLRCNKAPDAALTAHRAMSMGAVSADNHLPE